MFFTQSDNCTPLFHIFDIIFLIAAELDEPKIGIRGKGLIYLRDPWYQSSYHIYLRIHDTNQAIIYTWESMIPIKLSYIPENPWYQSSHHIYPRIHNIHFFNPFPNKPWFLHTYSMSFENTAGKGYLAQKEQFLHFLHCFLPFEELSPIFIQVKIAVCLLPQFGRV